MRNPQSRQVEPPPITFEGISLPACRAHGARFGAARAVRALVAVSAAGAAVALAPAPALASSSSYGYGSGYGGHAYYAQSGWSQLDSHQPTSRSTGRKVK